LLERTEFAPANTTHKQAAEGGKGSF